MRRFSLGDIPFVGKRFVERLERHQLVTVDDALAAGADQLRRWLGEREGAWLWDRIRGVDHGEVETGGDPKSISRDETFPEDIDDDAALKAELIRLVDRAAATMVHVEVDRITPMAVPLLIVIGREASPAGSQDEALLIEAEALAEQAMRRD